MKTKGRINEENCCVVYKGGDTCVDYLIQVLNFIARHTEAQEEVNLPTKC